MRCAISSGVPITALRNGNKVLLFDLCFRSIDVDPLRSDLRAVCYQSASKAPFIMIIVRQL